MVCGNADLNIINLPNGIKANQKCGGSDNDPEESEVRMIPAICRQCGKPYESRDPAVQQRWSRTRPETDGLCLECIREASEQEKPI